MTHFGLGLALATGGVATGIALGTPVVAAAAQYVATIPALFVASMNGDESDEDDE